MKNTVKIITLVLLALISGNVFSQSYSVLKFRKPTTTDNITWKFSSVMSGVDAFITVVGTKNASLSAIDDSTIYAHAWNPFITFARLNNASDSAYVTFRVTFKRTDGTAYSVAKFAMTGVDIDGSGLNSFREMYSVPSNTTPRSILGSTIGIAKGLINNLFVSSINTYSNIDTTNTIAMNQNDFTNTNTYLMNVGIVGRQSSSSTTRQFSFYFKPFNTMTFVLPVKMIDFNATAVNNEKIVTWKTTSEENANRFEVYRSIDGVNYTLVAEVAAAGYSQSLQSYTYSDNSVNENVTVFYKLKLVDNNGSFAWSKIVTIASTGATTKVQSVYPNPTHGTLNINLSEVSDELFTVEVMDAFGKVYQTINSSDLMTNNISFDLSDLNNGIYFVKISSEKGQSSLTKFIKN